MWIYFVRHDLTQPTHPHGQLLQTGVWVSESVVKQVDTIVISVTSLMIKVVDDQHIYPK